MFKFVSLHIIRIHWLHITYLLYLRQIQTQPHTVYKHTYELVLIFDNAVHFNQIGLR